MAARELFSTVQNKEKFGTESNSNRNGAWLSSISSLRIHGQRALAASLFFLAVCAPACCFAEDGHEAWLRYAPLADPAAYAWLPSTILSSGGSLPEIAAAAELARGLGRMLGRNFTVVRAAPPGQPAILLRRAAGGGKYPEQFRVLADRQRRRVEVIGESGAAELYAVFHLLGEVAAQRTLPAEDRQSPAASIRWTDEWDNPDGSVERGYAGSSIFFEGGHVRTDLTRAGEYARLLGSVGINGCNINNVNADLQTLSTANLHDFARVAEVFRPWGVHLALSIDLTSPQVVGGLPTFDPLDASVERWWRAKVDEIYRLIPDFGGFTVKADSEGRKGPSQYGRSPADAANVLARALAPHGGVVLYRGFVYNNHLDWQDPKADRARAGVDNFARYDGQFEPNVIIQIKEGPIDFQTREPVSPLFGALRHTNMAIEVQASQEYTGQQRHMVWLAPMWQWVLDTDLRIGGRATPVRDVVSGKTFSLPGGTSRPGGFVSVTNVGMEPNWLHHPMALANLYAFGRLAWDPQARLGEILEQWTRLTWGNDPEVVRTIASLQANSWRIYESYTGPNGMGTLTDILGVHFGPGIESAERNGWGQWFRGDQHGIGMDRTVATGTGFAGQYPPQLAARYESLASTPDDLLLFFHHVPYSYRLHSGKTLIQSIYDTHYAGALAAAEYVPQWAALSGKVDDERYQQVLDLFTFQAGHAIVWRDAICNWFQRISGIADAQRRVGNDHNRLEAESMVAKGYTVVEPVPWETTSGGKAVVCHEAAGCTLTTKLDKPAGHYNIAVQYFDLRTGVSRFVLRINGAEVARWSADAILPPAIVRPRLDGQTSTRYTAHDVALKPGDTLELTGIPDLVLHPDTAGHQQDSAAAPPGSAPAHEDARELAPVDYIEIGPAGPITPQ